MACLPVLADRVVFQDGERTDEIAYKIPRDGPVNRFQRLRCFLLARTAETEAVKTFLGMELFR